MQETVIRSTYHTPTLTLTRPDSGIDGEPIVFSLLYNDESYGELTVSFQDAGCPMLSVQLSGPQADENFADELLKICLLELMPDIGRPQAVLSIPDEWTALAPKYGFFPAGDGLFSVRQKRNFGGKQAFPIVGLPAACATNSPDAKGARWADAA